MNERKDIMRTRKAIWAAYLELSKEKSYAEITASDIIKKAGVSRATFYGHYRDIHELREEIENDFCSMSGEALLPSVRSLFTNTEQACYNILLFFEKNSSMICSVTASGTSEKFFHLCKAKMSSDILRCAFTGKINEESKLKCSMLASLLVDQGRETAMNEGGTYSISFRAKMLKEVIEKGIPSGR